MEDERGEPFKVVFSKIFGKDSTFVLDVQRKEVVQTFGGAADAVFKDPADRLSTFFGGQEKLEP
jgi:hypothetical protein